MFKKLDKNSFYYGFPVVLMTTIDSKNSLDNITPISSTWMLDNKLIVGIGIENKGFRNLKIESEATFNLPDMQLWKNVEDISKTSGREDIPIWKQQMGYVVNTNKFELGDFTRLPGKDVQTARIKECPIQIETKINQIFNRGSFAIVECQVKSILVDEKVLYDDSHIDVNQWNPLIYKFREYVTTGKSLGTNFRFNEHKE